MRVDHFVPESRRADLRLTWSNLYYSCDTCNNRKSNYPTDEELEQGLRFVDPCADDPHDNFCLVIEPSTGDYCQVENVTPTAAYTIRRLQFNRRSDLRDFWRELNAAERRWKQLRDCVIRLRQELGETHPDALNLLAECDSELERIEQRWPFRRSETPLGERRSGT